MLANKLIFQAGPWPATLGQSACGQHAYTLDLYAIPMICCSNDFKTTVQDGLSVEAADWISENILEASPPEGLAWYWPADPDGGVCYRSLDSAALVRRNGKDWPVRCGSLFFFLLSLSGVSFFWVSSTCTDRALVRCGLNVPQQGFS